MPAEPPAGDGSDAGTDATGTPRWVKVFAAIAIALVVLVIIVLITGRDGGHGPSRHVGVADGDENPAIAQTRE